MASKKKTTQRRRPLSGAALVAAARARGVSLGGRRRRRSGHGGASFLGVRGSVESIGMLALMALVLGGLLASFISLPAWLSPAGAALWLLGKAKNNHQAQWLGLALIAIGVLDQIGIGRWATQQLGGLFSKTSFGGGGGAATTPAHVVAALNSAGGGGVPSQLAGFGGFLQGAGQATADVLQALNTSSSTGAVAA